MSAAVRVGRGRRVRRGVNHVLGHGSRDKLAIQVLIVMKVNFLLGLWRHWHGTRAVASVFRAVSHRAPIWVPIALAVEAMPRLQIVRLGDVFGHPIGDGLDVAGVFDAQASLALERVAQPASAIELEHAPR